MTNELDCAIGAALQAGVICKNGQRKLTREAIHAKGNPHDLVTDVDRATEEFLREKLGAAFPGYGFFGEEYGKTDPDAEFRWVIDPIDGTNSFIHGTCFYSISIALQQHEKTVAGLVYAPALDEMFTAIRGKGAFLNGEPLHVSGCERFDMAMLATGFACLRAGLADNNMKFLDRILPQAMDLRRCGSAALDLAYVAAGRYDGFWELALNLYDVAAGVLLVEEAGGLVTAMSGKDAYPAAGIVAGTPVVHQRLIDEIRAVRCAQ